MLGRAIALASGFCSLTLLAHAAEPTLLHVNTFPTARSLPFYVAVDRGFFARRGLKVELEFTESSERQREGLAGGTVDIVHSAVDNAVAMIDVAKVDIVIVSGGDSGTNEFYVQDTIKDFSDIRGKAIVVDATNTAYALQARKILAQHGLRGRRRLFAQSGRQRPAAPQSPVRRQEQCRRHPQPALLAASRGQGHAQPRPHHRHARPLSGRRRLRAPRLGARQCGDAGELSRRLRRGAALVARSEQPRRGRGHSGRQAEAAAGYRRTRASR